VGLEKEKEVASPVLGQGSEEVSVAVLVSITVKGFGIVLVVGEGLDVNRVVHRGRLALSDRSGAFELSLSENCTIRVGLAFHDKVSSGVGVVADSAVPYV
jgi:hypothetical protein